MSGRRYRPMAKARKHGRARTPTAAKVSRRMDRVRPLDGRLRLAFTDCLGPCSEANVIFVYAHGRPLWLRRINTVEMFAQVLAWAREIADGGPVAPPAALAGHAFAWTGGGPGPIPPVADA